MTWWKLSLVGLLVAALTACGGGGGRRVVTVAMAPIEASIAPLGTIQFFAQVSGADDITVSWFVNDVASGNNTVGTISSFGLYTAPATVPSPNTVTVKVVANADSTATATATVTIDSGIAVRVTPAAVVVGTGETLQFTAQLTGTANQNVTWEVNEVAGGDATKGTITANGLYTAPANVPSPASVNVRAVSVEDTAKFGTALVAISAAADPTLTAVHPTHVPQGGVFVDLFLTGTNLLSTSTVRFGGVEVASTFASLLSMRARVPASLLQNAGTFEVNVQRQSGITTDSFEVLVEPVRPALVGTTPDSVAQGMPGGGAVSVTLNGGFFATPSVDIQFNGNVVTAEPVSTRQWNAILDGSAITEAGLFPLTVRNILATPSTATANLAVQPPGSSPSAAANIAVGMAPAGVAINTATGIAVITNRGSNSISLVNLATSLVESTVAVGSEPVGVGVDPLRNVAVVANRGDHTVSIVNLATATVAATISDVGNAPFAVGVNPLSGRALIARQSTNSGTVLDLDTNTILGTVEISTGDNPAVAVDPGLNWAIVTPGGTGLLSIVDMGRLSVVAQVTVGLTVRGVAINTQTRRALLVNPATNSGLIFSLLDQAVTNVPDLGLGHLAVAVNPFTDIGVSVETSSDTAQVIDLRTPVRLATVPVGVDPRAVAIDPGSNVAVVVNEGSNSVTLIALGAIRPLHVELISPAATLTSGDDLTVEVLGHGFVGGSQVRLDQMPLATTVLSARRLTATVPAALLGEARRLALDVINPGAGNVLSNVTDLVVVQEVPVGTAPRAVSVDQERNLAVVANAGSDDISVVDLATGTVVDTIPVGVNPQGVAILTRDGIAVVSNRGSNTVSLVDLAEGTVIHTVSVGGEPLGVTIDEHFRFGFVANAASNTVTRFNAINGTEVININVDLRPVAVAFDLVRNMLAVAHATQNNVSLVSISTDSIVARVSGLQIPTDIVFDPVSDRFLVVSSLSNNLGIINPDTAQTAVLRVGLNPTGLDNNPHTATLVTANTASRSMTVMDFLDRRVRAILDVDAGTTSALNPCRQDPGQPTSPVQTCTVSVRILPFRNLAVVTDEGRDRIILFPLPR